MPELHEVVKRLSDLFKCKYCEKQSTPETLYVWPSECSKNEDPTPMCAECRRTCTSCQTKCQVVWNERASIENSTTHLLSLYELVPKRCQFSSDGCKLVSVLEKHEAFCQFRPFECVVGDDMACNWQGTVKDWQDHVTAKHPTFVESYAMGKEYDMCYISFNSDSWQNRCYSHVVNDRLFLLFVGKKRGELYQAVRQVSVRKPTHHYYFKFTFRTDNVILYKYSMRSLEYNISDIDDEIVFDNSSVPIYDLISASSGDDLQVSFEVISKKKVEEEDSDEDED